MPYRTVLRDGRKLEETLTDHLPRNPLVTMRSQVASVDGDNCFAWTQYFMEHRSDLTQNSCKVLVTFVGYRSHITLRVLALLRNNDVIVYAIPAQVLSLL